jgi:hypothetical protein
MNNLTLTTYTKIYPYDENNNTQNIKLHNWICKQYYKTKNGKLNNILNGLNRIFNINRITNDPYFDPNFIVIEKLSKEQIHQQLDIFITIPKNSFAYNDIAKYIRKYWTNKSIKYYVDIITKYLITQSDTSKYWFFEFYPLLDKQGEKLILDIISVKSLEGLQTELLYGIYLMEPEKLSNYS